MSAMVINVPGEEYMNRLAAMVGHAAAAHEIFEDASEPIEETRSVGRAARTLNVAPGPIVHPSARADSARVHEPSPAPKAVSRAVERPAQGNEDGSTPSESTDAKERPASAHEVPPVAHAYSVSRARPGDGWIHLRVWAEMFFDVQKARCACDNRAERGEVVKDEYIAQLAMLKEAEHKMGLGLVNCYRRVVPKPIRDWQKASIGIGEHALARLLGQLGHPAIALPKHWEETPNGEHKRILVADEPYVRTLRQLWAYCGHGDSERKRRKDMDQADALAMGSPSCKMILHQLLAAPCIRYQGTEYHGRSPYRDVYDSRRATTVDREDWTDGHKHNDALRVTGKEILRDLWLAALQDSA